MSAPTLTEPGYEIREGFDPVKPSAAVGREAQLLHQVAQKARRAFVEGFVGDVAVAAGFEVGDIVGIDELSGGWLVAPYLPLAELADAGRPTAFRAPNADDARRWVTILTALYAKAVAA